MVRDSAAKKTSARKPRKVKASRKTRRPRAKFSEKDLTKGQLRKLTALRKSLGNKIADKAFAEWFKTQAGEVGSAEDKNAVLIAQALQPLIERNKLKIPRGGYLLNRGRGRVVVERGASK